MITSQPVFLALVASAFFGSALVVTQFGLRHLAAADGALISIPTTALLLWLLCPFNLVLSGWRATAVMIFALVGLFFPAAVTLLTYEANHRMGPATAGAVGSTTPLFAAAAAVLVLGEKLTMLAAAGTLMTVSGIVLLTWQPKAQPVQWPAQTLALPLVAAMLRGIAQAAIKLALTLWPSAFAATLIGYSVSTASVALDARLRRRTPWPRFKAKGAIWFALVGVCNGAAVLVTYVALKSGPVTVVAPMVATYPVFALLIAALVLPDQKLTLRAAAAVTLIVLGVRFLMIAVPIS